MSSGDVERPARLLVHIIGAADWSAAAGAAYEAESLASQGFIHLSLPEQVVLAADTHYRDEPDLVLLCIDADRLDATQLRFEAGSPPNQHLVFPHLYGPLPLSAVTAVVPFPAGPDGHFPLPAQLGGVAFAPWGPAAAGDRAGRWRPVHWAWRSRSAPWPPWRTGGRARDRGHGHGASHTGRSRLPR